MILSNLSVVDCSFSSDTDGGGWHLLLLGRNLWCSPVPCLSHRHIKAVLTSHDTSCFLTRFADQQHFRLTPVNNWILLASFLCEHEWTEKIEEVIYPGIFLVFVEPVFFSLIFVRKLNRLSGGEVQTLLLWHTLHFLFTPSLCLRRTVKWHIVC